MRQCLRIRLPEVEMTSAEGYRAKATNFIAQAKREKIELVRAEYARLARLYQRLAEQAERNADIHAQGGTGD